MVNLDRYDVNNEETVASSKVYTFSVV